VVSGSNMAGKTTFLRAAGLSALLAQAGGPVPAQELSIRRCRVRTSVRIEDDPAHGVSLFLAEAQRLQAIVRQAEDPSRPPVFFLLDEILHGTNAEDRREAIRLVLRRLAATPAFGLVTTHDPEIARGVRSGADGGAGDSDARQLHFRETVTAEGGSVRMHFDYLARLGPATSRNALTILRTLGLS
jgi:DNA mismatch repair ATPase MutS